MTRPYKDEPSSASGQGSDRNSLAATSMALQARGRLRQMAAAAQAFDLVDILAESSWVDLLALGARGADIAQALSLPVQQVSDVLEALRASAVVIVQGGRYEFTPDMAALLAEPSGVSLKVVLGDLRLQRRRASEAMRRPLGPISDHDALALARDWGVLPATGAQELYTLLYGAFPDARDKLASGGRFLDVGSGVGGALLTTAALFPQLEATGIEISPVVGQELRHRAVANGLSDRVNVIIGDARELHEHEAYSVAYWAQEFFDADARAEVLRNILAALVPGGVLLLQETFPAIEDGESIERALDGLFYRGLGATFAVAAEALLNEAVAAGFGSGIVESTPAGRMVMVTRPGART